MLLISGSCARIPTSPCTAQSSS